MPSHGWGASKSWGSHCSPGVSRVTFTRQKADNWTRDVPGARWLKADLHIHTLDDHPGGRAKMPHGISGEPHDPANIRAYARRFLHVAAERGVQVLGLTPHSPTIGPEREGSAVWQIVKEWNDGVDDDGTPFRERIYAVFPGFEPSLNDGRSGLHLLFLFDPEIGRDDYLKSFDLVMAGLSPWTGGPDNQLRISSRSAGEAFAELREFHRRGCSDRRDGGARWNYLALAPHIDSDKGLLGAQKAQVLELFQHQEVAGLELKDSDLPEDTVGSREWLGDGMARYRQAFLHGSDAYKVDDIGSRHTWLKLASPRIEALRQSLIARESRVRMGYVRGSDGSLSEVQDPPDVTRSTRPWLKSLRVSGKASFFGASGENGSGGHFEFSPDLTCIIGGSMTGKSTLLDGLRIHIGAELPQDDAVRSQVEARGRGRFLGGAAQVELDCPSKESTAPPGERWPAVFYTQSELQTLAGRSGAVQDILARLVAPETQGIVERKERLVELDGELAGAARRLAGLGDDLTDAEQALQRSEAAAAEIGAFADAGVEDLNRVSGNLGRWKSAEMDAGVLALEALELTLRVAAFEVPKIDEALDGAQAAADQRWAGQDLRDRWDRIRASLRSAREDLNAVQAAIGSIRAALESRREDLSVEVDRNLAERGLDGAKINQLQELTARGSLLESYQSHFDRLRSELANAETAFESLRGNRRSLVSEQRCAFDRVIAQVRSQFGGRIEARRIDEGRKDALEDFLRALGQRGITRWWNELEGGRRPTPDQLLDGLDAGRLADYGMSSAVQETFTAQLTPSRRRELEALRCDDDYVLEFRMDDGTYRLLAELSGGQRVNLLLSLLLETEDERPLVIDQPEDELDNRFLFETMLPALRRLKGRRQIIFATHNANIVVNGDADQVIQLEATADRGRVSCSGAIEDPAVRDAIVRTVDGGDEAFRLRRLKYGF